MLFKKLVFVALAGQRRLGRGRGGGRAVRRAHTALARHADAGLHAQAALAVRRPHRARPPGRPRPRPRVEA